MGDYSGIGTWFKILFYLCLIFVPLGIWKVIDIIIWIWNNV